MNDSLPVGCVIMASGLSRRFGSNKLLANFCGEPVLCRAFAVTDTPQLAARIVVTRSEQVRDLCEAHRIPALLHNLPGRNDTVRLGLSALLEQLPELAGCMFLPGDQPLLRRTTVEQLVEHFQAQNKAEQDIFRLGAQALDGLSPLVGSPVLFGKRYFPELLTLPEGKGGSVLLKQYPARVHIVCIADREELLDADTPQALAQLEALAGQVR